MCTRTMQPISVDVKDPHCLAMGNLQLGILHCSLWAGPTLNVPITGVRAFKVNSIIYLYMITIFPK